MVLPDDLPPTTGEEIKTGIITADDRKVLEEIYRQKFPGDFTNEEVEELVKAYNEKRPIDQRAIAILKRYDTDNDGIIKHLELEKLKHHLELTETPARYMAYTSAFARAFRYLAFTSDFGEALRPVVIRNSVVMGTFAIAIGYCAVDSGYEAYKLKRNGNITENNEHMTTTQCLVERVAFHSVASIGGPFLLIHSTVHMAHWVCSKLKKFRRWGPSISGLALVPLLPFCLDKPAERAIDHIFHKYGPWAHPPPDTRLAEAVKSTK